MSFFVPRITDCGKNRLQLATLSGKISKDSEILIENWRIEKIEMC